MPILWRYALHSYLRIFFLSVFAFITVLIVARFKEIARFTALSGSFGKTGLYIAYQIPTILPIAIPISAFIGAILCFQRFSRTGELTSLRASGLSLTKLSLPFLLMAGLLALFNFSLCAEIAPFCRRECKNLLYRETSENPLLLLQRKKFVKLKNAYLDMEVQDEETSKNLTLIAPHAKNGTLSLVSARKLWMKEELLMGEDFAFISYLPAEIGFDSLIIENQSSMTTSAPFLSSAMKKNRPKIDALALNLKMLRLSQKKSTANVEIFRRISLALSVVSLTLIGCAFGIERARTRSKKNLLFALLLTLSIFMSYLLAKDLKKAPLFASLALLLPHPLTWGCSIFQFYRISRGKA